MPLHPPFSVALVIITTTRCSMAHRRGHRLGLILGHFWPDINRRRRQPNISTIGRTNAIPICRPCRLIMRRLQADYPPPITCTSTRTTCSRTRDEMTYCDDMMRTWFHVQYIHGSRSSAICQVHLYSGHTQIFNPVLARCRLRLKRTLRYMCALTFRKFKNHDKWQNREDMCCCSRC